MTTCPRCQRTFDPRSGVRVPRDPDAVSRWDGLPDVPTVTVCMGCRLPEERYWAAND